MKMSEPTTSRTYDVWSRIYDNTFGVLVRNRQIRALHQLQVQSGDRVLDIGVGTGMTLPHYPRDVTVVGLDLSGGMLAKASEKVRELGLQNCHLVRADAMHPPFVPHSFDHILISHTISVVSDPNKLIDWAVRLLKPGGRIVLLNHFQSSHRFMAWGERVLNPIFVKIGWRSDLSLEEILSNTHLKVAYHFKPRLIDLWQIVVLTDPSAPARQQAQSPSPPSADPTATATPNAYGG